jgi:anti-sigma regulatory factor (Ser/Thr protein kinase)
VDGTKHTAEGYLRAWYLVAHGRDIERWRNEAAAVVKALGGDAAAVELVRLGVSELLSNVIKHVKTDRSCELVVERDGDHVRVQVLDCSTAVPAITVPDWDTESGRGLWLLGEMAADWGYICLPGGKSVWFTCRLMASTPEAAA